MYLEIGISIFNFDEKIFLEPVRKKSFFIDCNSQTPHISRSV